MKTIQPLSIPIALSVNEHNLKAKNTRRHPLLATGTFVKHGIEFDVTKDKLINMADVLSSGKIGAKRSITMGHPSDISKHDTEPAVGWLLSNTAEVSAYGDGHALYADIEWLPATEKKIKNKEYAYLSPVFFSNIQDYNTGEDLGWTMKFAAITNDPHWVDQPELWAAFTASYQSINNTASKAENHKTRGDDMDLREATEKIAQLSAENQALQSQVAQLTADLEKEKTQGVAFSADIKSQNEQLELVKSELKESKEKADKLEGEAKKIAGDALIAQFTASGHLQKKHLEKESLKTMAYDEPEKFKEIVALFSATPPKTTPQGANVDDGTEKTALDLAKEHCDKNPGVPFQKAYFDAKQKLKGNTL